MTSEIKVDTISENTSANGVTIDGLTIKDGNIIGDVALAGTTPTFTIGDAGAEDAALIFDGNQVDFVMGVDDSADEFRLGVGTALGSTRVIEIDSDGATVFQKSVTFAGSTPTVTIGDAGAEDAKIVFDGNARDYHIGLDDSADSLILGFGSALGTTEIITLSPSAVVFNEDSQNLDFRVESNDATHQLFVDGGNNKVYIGSGSGNSIDNMHLQLQNQGLTVSSFANDANSNEIHFIKSRNTTVGSSTVVSDGDQLGGLVFQGDDGTDYATPGASIRAIVGGTPGGNDMPGALIFSTTADGASSVTERMRIHSDGIVSIPGGIELGSGLDGTAVNVLDDYEEGTWDPAATFNDDGATGHGGKYTKIGNVVIVTFNITFGSVNFGAVISVSGLPFSATTQSGLGIGGAMIKGYYDGSSTNLSGYIGDNTSQIDLRENEVHLTHNSDKILGKNLRGTAVYHVN